MEKELHLSTGDSEKIIQVTCQIKEKDGLWFTKVVISNLYTNKDETINHSFPFQTEEEALQAVKDVLPVIKESLRSSGLIVKEVFQH